MTLQTVYSVVLRKGSHCTVPVPQATELKINKRKTKGRRFNPLTVQMIYGERKNVKNGGENTVDSIQ